MISFGGLTNGTSQKWDQRYAAKSQRPEHKIFAALCSLEAQHRENHPKSLKGGALSWLERLNWKVSPFQASGAVQEHIIIASGHKIYKKSVAITVELVLVPIMLVGTPYLTLSDLPPVFTFLFPSRGTTPNLGCHQIQFGCAAEEL